MDDASLTALCSPNCVPFWRRQSHGHGKVPEARCREGEEQTEHRRLMAVVLVCPHYLEPVNRPHQHH
jgi:hypothetical protein